MQQWSASGARPCDEMFESSLDAVAFGPRSFDDVQFRASGASGFGLVGVLREPRLMRSFLVRPRSAPPSLSFHACVIIALVESFSPAFRNWSGQFHCAQSHRGRPWIHGDFFLGRFDGASRQFFEERHHIRGITGISAGTSAFRP